MIISKMSFSSSTINSDFDLVSASSMINTMKQVDYINYSNAKENNRTNNASSSQNVSTSSSNNFCEIETTKNNAILLQQLKQTKKTLAKCQEKNSRLESELDQNRSLMAKILACQITAKNKWRENSVIIPLDERCGGIKTFDSLAWNPLIEQLEVELIDLFVHVPPPLIPRLLGHKGGLISPTIFKSLISLTTPDISHSNATPPLCIILLPNIHVASRYVTYLSDEAVNVLFTRGLLFDMVCLSKSSNFPTFCLTTCSHLLIEFISENNGIALKNLTLLLMDEADFLIQDIDFVQCFLHIKSRAPQSYRTLLFSRTLDDKISSLLPEILKVGYKNLTVGERPIETSRCGSTVSDQSEARLIDFDEYDSVSINELETNNNKQAVEEEDNSHEQQLLIENDNVDISAINEEQNNIPGTSIGLHHLTEVNGAVDEQYTPANKKDYWPVEFMDIRPPQPPSIVPVFVEKYSPTNLNQNKNVSTFETDNEEDNVSSFFNEERIEEQQENGILINLDQRQSTSTLGDMYQSCLASFNSVSTRSSTNISSQSFNTNSGSHLNQAENCSSNQEQRDHLSTAEFSPLPPLRISSFFSSEPIDVRQNHSPNLSEPAEIHQSALFPSISNEENFGTQHQPSGIQSEIQILKQRIDRLEQQNPQFNVHDDPFICLDVRLDNIEDDINRLTGIEENYSSRIDRLEAQNDTISQRVSDTERRIERIEQSVVPNKNNKLLEYLNTLGQLNSDGELILNRHFNCNENFKDLIFVGNLLNIKGIVISAAANFKVSSFYFIDEIIEHAILSTNSVEMIPWLVINFTSSNKLDWPKNLLLNDNNFPTNYDQPRTSVEYIQENSIPHIKKRQIKANKIIYTLLNVHLRTKFVVELYFDSKKELYKKAHGFTIRRV